MPSNVYHFKERWTIPDHSPEAVWRVIIDATLLPKWWRGVYLESTPIAPYSQPAVGARFRVRARGFLPYKLNFILECTELEQNSVVAVRSLGDFQGQWRAVVSPHEGGAHVDTTWQVTVLKPIVRWLSPLLRPLFAWNHRWTTPRGEAGLRAYLAEHRQS